MQRKLLTENVYRVISKILKQEFSTDQKLIKDETGGWDSLKHIEIMFAIEEELDVQFSEHELAELDSAEKIIEIIQARHEA